jgi:hypothetical protein
MLALGLLVWIAGTVYYACPRHQVLETTQLRFWVSFFISSNISAILVVCVLKLLRIRPSYWASAALFLAIPGMVGEAVALLHLSTFKPRIQESSGGRMESANDAR